MLSRGEPSGPREPTTRYASDPGRRGQAAWPRARVYGRVAGPVRSPEYGPGDESALKEGLRVVAIVPARGGTDRVPYLNIKRLGDGPLLAHTLNAARGSRYVDRVVVSTDDAHVAEVAPPPRAAVPSLPPPPPAAPL